MPEIDPNGRNPLKFADICVKCGRCFQWVKSPCKWCFWCHNPEPKAILLTAHKPINQTEKKKPHKDYALKTSQPKSKKG